MLQLQRQLCTFCLKVGISQTNSKWMSGKMCWCNPIRSTTALTDTKRWGVEGRSNIDIDVDASQCVLLLCSFLCTFLLCDRSPASSGNKEKHQFWDYFSAAFKDTRYKNTFMLKDSHPKTSQELRMLSRSLSDCKSLLLNVMIQVSQFIRNGQLCH